MTINYARNLASSSLSALYENSEALSIADRLLLDMFGVTTTDRLLKGDTQEVDEARFETALQRLSNGEPVQYVVGFEWFCDMRFELNSSTLIPRVETEELAQWIISDTPQRSTVLDIGTGSGALAVTLARHIEGAKVSAIDISREAIEMARGNAKANSVEVEFIEMDIFEYVPLKENFDVIVSNPPYVCEREKPLMHSNVLDFEPHRALFVSDEDPLIFYRHIATLAARALKPDGKLYFEINEAYPSEMVELLESLGFVDIMLKEDIRQKPRMICGRKK